MANRNRQSVEQCRGCLDSEGLDSKSSRRPKARPASQEQTESAARGQGSCEFELGLLARRAGSAVVASQSPG